MDRNGARSRSQEPGAWKKQGYLAPSPRQGTEWVQQVTQGREGPWTCWWLSIAFKTSLQLLSRVYRVFSSWDTCVSPQFLQTYMLLSTPVLSPPGLFIKCFLY
jgi:hypothetical protein